MGGGLTTGEPNIQELLNQITLLREVLKYYAENSTYACKNGVAPIDGDRGHQARFVLEQSGDIEKYNQELIENYNKAIEQIKEQMDEPNDKNWERVLKVNELMKNIK